MRRGWMGVAMATALALPGAARASGNHFHEQGTPLMGAAYAGQAAVAEDASTAYYNPAGMVRLDRSELLIGTLVGQPKFEFQDDGRSTGSAGDGGDAAQLVAGGTLLYVLRLVGVWRAGNSATAAIITVPRSRPGKACRTAFSRMLVKACPSSPG